MQSAKDPKKDRRDSKDKRKELAREYKRTPKNMGAYSILNTQSQKRFVGVSRDVEARLNRHRFMLKTNSERDNDELQADWNAQGADVFEFTVLEIIEPQKDTAGYNPDEDLEVLAQLLFDQLKPFSPNGYNKQRDE